MIPVHNHSEYSALDGCSKVTEIATRIEEIGAPGAFLTDHGNVAGWRAFDKAMKARDLFAGFGMEGYQASVHRKHIPEKRKQDAFHVILLAQNPTGVRNLMCLSDAANRDGYYYKPRLDWELLEEYNEGLVCTSACAMGLVARGIVNDDHSDLNRYLNIFGDRFFIELHTYKKDKFFEKSGMTQGELNEQLVGLAVERGIPLVYANDAHYTHKDHYPYHEVMLAMQMNKSLDDEDRMSHPPCLYIMDEKEVSDALDYLPRPLVDQAILNSDIIMQMCREAKLEEPRMHLPRFQPREKVEGSNSSLLVKLVEDGCEQRYGDVTDEVEDRAIMELETILGSKDQVLVDYFLITWDFCNWLDAQGIERGPGRGSAGGSLVSYVLGITDVDPIKYNLYFERFYNAGREEGLPDIDTDVERAGRPLVLQYFKDRYGQNNVIPIGTHIRMKPLATIDKLGKPLGIPYNDIENIKKIIKVIPDIGILSAEQIGWHSGPGIKVAVLEDEVASVKLAPFIEEYPDLFECAEFIGGRISTYGIHASAVVVSDVDVRGCLPAMMLTARDVDGTKSDRQPATQIEMREVEKLGFPKMDILGLRTLDTLKQVRVLTGGA